MHEVDLELISPFSVGISIQTDFELYEPIKMLKNWEAIESTSTGIEIKLDLDDPVLVSFY